MKKGLYDKNKVLIWTIFGIGMVFFLWWLISYLLKTTLFPGPQVVIPLFFNLFTEKETWVAIGGTLLRLTISITVSALIGLVLGTISGLNESFRSLMKPFIIILRTIPTAAVIYIFIFIIRPAYAPILVVFLAAFPIIYEAVVTGITTVDPAIIDAMKIDGARKRYLDGIFHIFLPHATPNIILGFVQSLGLGMKVSIMSEILCGSSSMPGLGRMIYVYSLTVEMDYILAFSLMAILLIGLIEIAVYFAKKKSKRKFN